MTEKIYVVSTGQMNQKPLELLGLFRSRDVAEKLADLLRAKGEFVTVTEYVETEEYVQQRRYG